MKQILLSAAIAAMMGTGIFLAKSTTPQNDGLSDINLANAEALAEYESKYPCPDGCMEWSGNSGGGIACDCGRYIGKCKRRCA